MRLTYFVVFALAVLPSRPLLAPPSPLSSHFNLHNAQNQGDVENSIMVIETYLSTHWPYESREDFQRVIETAHLISNLLNTFSVDPHTRLRLARVFGAVADRAPRPEETTTASLAEALKNVREWATGSQRAQLRNSAGDIARQVLDHAQTPKKYAELVLYMMQEDEYVMALVLREALREKGHYHFERRHKLPIGALILEMAKVDLYQALKFVQFPLGLTYFTGPPSDRVAFERLPAPAGVELADQERVNNDLAELSRKLGRQYGQRSAKFNFLTQTEFDYARTALDGLLPCSHRLGDE